jgi:hypothetical protein
MYTRPEMALRIGLFYTAASLSGAFGGRCYLLIYHVVSDLEQDFSLVV